eukprot:TRINITY_DN3754_c0_g1_i1.p1 TRINITY_DN3754_c0_g1~~TRINITY_DN3754_c0_g1_i1.p1  ORF type:complete len:301 (-),score=47.82 TRINITY_DN3754_c0_g1_i1:500-1402(-)
MSMADNVGAYGHISGTVPVAGGADHILQFQDSGYSAPGPSSGKITSSSAGRDGDASFSTPLQPVVGEQPQAASRGSMFSVVYYRPYFDVDTSDVIERIRDSLFPFNTGFHEKTSANPDMYGPFWIATTLIFLTSTLGNLASFIHYTDKESPWHYNINKVTWAATIFYGYVGVVPVVLYFALQYFGMATGLVQLWCLYGYSLFVFLPASIICVVPLELLRWIAVGAAAGVSTTFLFLNLRLYIKASSEHWLAVTIVASLLQLGLALVLKLYFFTFLASHSSTHPPPFAAHPPPAVLAPPPA